MKKLLIIDGNSILNRAYYGIRVLNAPDGTPTNAVYGFLNILFKNLEEDPPDYLCVAFDVKEKTFRHKMYDLYKAQRKPAPDDFLVQLPLIKEVLGAMNCVCLEKPGYEADDIIGTVSRICEEHSVECSILTGDKDDLQLASDLVKVKLVISKMGSTTTTVYGADEVYEKYMVTPAEFIDVKGLMGDSSDNIPGVKGIGEKTAFALIRDYKSIEKIYEDIEQINATPSVKKKLEDGKNSAFLSKTLATIDRNVPIDFDIETCRIKEYNNNVLAEVFKRLNFKSFSDRLGLKTTETGEKVAFDIECKEIDEKAFLQNIKDGGAFAYKLENVSDFGAADIIYTANGNTVFNAKKISTNSLKLFFEDSDCKKIGFNVKNDILWLKEKNIVFNGLCFDVAIAAYILEPSRAVYDVRDLAFRFLNLEFPDTNTEDENGQFSFDFDADNNKDNEAICTDVSAIFKLWKKFDGEIKSNGQTKLYYEVELPLVEVLADMQYTGVFVDKSALVEFGKNLKQNISQLEQNICGYAGKTFNINSPKQLGEILFDVLKLPHGKKTKTGYSTNVEVLKKLQNVHPIINDILEYRSLTKLQSTYVDGLLAVINPITGRIHSNFNQTVTTTGRISSTEPNLQNIPVRTERGRQMRRMFVAEGECVLVDADYSQIELRVLAHIANDKNMQNAFLLGTDIHTQTASQVFNVPVNEVTPEMRSGAKAVNFGIVYGIGEFSLSQDLKISIKEAKQYIENYLNSYPCIKKYMEKIIADGRRDGYVTTLLNRRRYIPELRASNRITQSFGERVALNAPIQGTAADIIKIAMVNVYKRLKTEKMDAKLILQVHDELIVEAPLSEAQRVKEILTDEMERAMELCVPLKIDCNIGKTWYDTK